MNKRLLFGTVLMFLLLIGCSLALFQSQETKQSAPEIEPKVEHKLDVSEYAMTYQVKKLAGPMVIDGNWDKQQWQGVEPLWLTHHMSATSHRPKTQAKMLYDDEAIYVIFRVEDRYVRAVEQKINGQVCLDSCVEMFFTPGPDVALGYYNLEINCIGTTLLHGGPFSKPYDLEARKIDKAQIKKIEVAHSLPARKIDPEITDPITWTLEYRFPLSILDDRCPITKPGPGVFWRANFYKCGDKTSHPHWISWSRVDPKLGVIFHVPEFFGVLAFE